MNTHFRGTGFIPLDFTLLILIGIDFFFDRKLLTPEMTDIFYKYSFGLDIAALRVSGSPASVEIELFHAH